MAERNKQAGEQFLAENSKKEGVVTLPSGLQYKVIKAGDGNKPTAGDVAVWLGALRWQGIVVTALTGCRLTACRPPGRTPPRRR